MGKGDNVKNSLLLEDREIHLNGNTPRQRVKDRFTCYEIMHGLILIIGVLHACCHLNENMRKKF